MVHRRGVRKLTLSQLPWKEYPLRICRSLHHCEVCDKDITLGEQYFDGGHSRRAHRTCIITDGQMVCAGEIK